MEISYIIYHSLIHYISRYMYFDLDTNIRVTILYVLQAEFVLLERWLDN